MITHTLKQTGFIAVTVLLLGACSTANVKESAYPDRHKFSFETKDGTKYTYLCKDNAQKQAEKAHAYVISHTGDVAVETMGDILKRSQIKGDDNDKNNPSVASLMWSSLSASLNINDGDKERAKKVEEKFQCILIKARN